MPVTAGTLNPVELGEVVATRDKLRVPNWTACYPRLAARFFLASGPWVTPGESPASVPRVQRRLQMATRECVP